jgi:hypothetical protein
MFKVNVYGFTESILLNTVYEVHILDTGKEYFDLTKEQMQTAFSDYRVFGIYILGKNAIRLLICEGSNEIPFKNIN